jgi:hypothetical protein
MICQFLYAGVARRIIVVAIVTGDSAAGVRVIARAVSSQRAKHSRHSHHVVQFPSMHLGLSARAWHNNVVRVRVVPLFQGSKHEIHSDCIVIAVIIIIAWNVLALGNWRWCWGVLRLCEELINAGVECPQ